MLADVLIPADNVIDLPLPLIVIGTFYNTIPYTHQRMLG